MSLPVASTEGVVGSSTSRPVLDLDGLPGEPINSTAEGTAPTAGQLFEAASEEAGGAKEDAAGETGAEIGGGGGKIEPEPEPVEIRDEATTVSDEVQTVMGFSLVGSLAVGLCLDLFRRLSMAKLGAALGSRSGESNGFEEQTGLDIVGKTTTVAATATTMTANPVVCPWLLLTGGRWNRQRYGYPR